MSERQIYSASHIQDLLEDWAESHPDPLIRQAVGTFIGNQISREEMREAKLSSYREGADGLLADLDEAARSLGGNHLNTLIALVTECQRLDKKRQEPAEGKVIPFKREGDHE